MPMPTTKAVTAAGYMTSDCLSEEFSRRRIYITGEICDALAADGPVLFSGYGAACAGKASHKARA